MYPDGEGGFVDDPFALEVTTPPTTSKLEVNLEDENDEHGPDSDEEATTDDAPQKDEGTMDVEGNCAMDLTPFDPYEKGDH